jgi:VWFA-related protein
VKLFPSPPMRRRLGVVALVTALAGAAATEGQAPETKPQEPQRPTFRLDANFVRVDIYPTADGKPVTDLTAEDFEVLEDGVPQQIETFERVEIAGQTPVGQRRDPNNVADMRAQAENPRARVFVIFLDTGGTELSGSHAMQRSLVSMLDQMLAPDDLFAVMTPQMSPSDLAFARKTETIEGYLRRYWTWGQRDRLYPEDPIERQYVDCYPGPAGQIISNLAQELIDRRREKFALDALHDLSLYLRGLREERKAVIAVTIGWLLPRENRGLQGPGPQPGQVGTTPSGRLTTDKMKSEYGSSNADCEKDRQTLANVDLFQDYQDLIDVANRSNVSIYPVDSRGLAASDTPAGFGPQRSVADDIQRVRRRVEGLRTLALDTDGIAVIDTNDLDTGLKRIVADMSSYYLVGYYTKNAKLDGRFRKITVRVKRPGVNVRARRGYKAATAAELAPPKETAAKPSGPPEAVVGALSRITTSRARPSHTSVAFVRRGSEAAGPVRMWTAVELDPSSMKGDFANGGEVSIVVAGTDGASLAQGRGTLAPGARTVIVDLGDVAPAGGDVVVRTRIKPQGEGETLTDSATIAGASLSHAAPLLWRRGPSTQMKFVPTADTRFARADRLRAEVLLADASSTVTASLLDRMGATIAVPVTVGTRADGAMTWATAELALVPLAPSEYVLKMTVAGPGGPIDVYTGIRVVP